MKLSNQQVLTQEFSNCKQNLLSKVKFGFVHLNTFLVREFACFCDFVLSQAFNIGTLACQFCFVIQIPRVV